MRRKSVTLPVARIRNHLIFYIPPAVAEQYANSEELFAGEDNQKRLVNKIYWLKIECLSCYPLWPQRLTHMTQWWTHKYHTDMIDIFHNGAIMNPNEFCHHKMMTDSHVYLREFDLRSRKFVVLIKCYNKLIKFIVYLITNSCTIITLIHYQPLSWFQLWVLNAANGCEFLQFLGIIVLRYTWFCRLSKYL